MNEKKQERSAPAPKESMTVHFIKSRESGIIHGAFLSKKQAEKYIGGEDGSLYVFPIQVMIPPASEATNHEPLPAAPEKWVNDLNTAAEKYAGKGCWAHEHHPHPNVEDSYYSSFKQGAEWAKKHFKIKNQSPTPSAAPSMKWVKGIRQSPKVSGEYFIRHIDNKEKEIANYVLEDDLWFVGWINIDRDSLEWLSESPQEGEGKAEIESLKNRMNRFLASTTPEQLVKIFEDMGYVFEKIDQRKD